MIVKYERTSHLSQQQEGRRTLDKNEYDQKFFDCGISGSVPFKQRPEASKLIKLVESGDVKTIVTDDFSRLGRNTGDIISQLEYFHEKEINVRVLDKGMESRPNGKPNPMWKLISSILASVYELELENIRERTHAGRVAFVQRGGKLGRPKGTNESVKKFLEKPKNQKIVALHEKGRTFSEIQKLLNCSPSTVSKVLKHSKKYA